MFTWIDLSVNNVAVVFLQDSDLKQYLDNCGNLMSMHNVKVSHENDSAAVNHYWIYTTEQIHTIIILYIYFIHIQLVI